jgi:hypothetical protein
LKRQSPKDKGLLVRVQSEAKYIWYINGIFEGYDGLAVVRTLDKEKGIIELLSTADQSGDLHKLLQELSDEIGLIVFHERDGSEFDP